MNSNEQAAIIKAYITRGDAAGHPFYVQAGKLLIQLKDAAPKQFRKTVTDKVGIGLTRAYDLMKLAREEITLDEQRAKTAKRTREARKRQKESPRSGRLNSHTADILPFPLRKRDTTPMGDNLEGDRDEKAGAFLNIIQEFDRMAGFVTDLNELSHFATLANAAERAVKKWTDLATKLRRLASEERLVVPTRVGTTQPK